jgi:hypothetical protein
LPWLSIGKKSIYCAAVLRPGGIWRRRGKPLIVKGLKSRPGDFGALGEAREAFDKAEDFPEEIISQSQGV